MPKVADRINEITVDVMDQAFHFFNLFLDGFFGAVVTFFIQACIDECNVFLDFINRVGFVFLGTNAVKSPYCFTVRKVGVVLF